MSAYVVDASVAVKWYVPEIHADRAATLLGDDHELHIPDLFLAEFGNILWKKVVRGELTDSEAKSIVQSLWAVPLRRHSSEPLLEAAVETALLTSRTVYDSLYVTLAVSLNCLLVTADEHLWNALHPTALSAHLQHVKDL